MKNRWIILCGCVILVIVVSVAIFKTGNSEKNISRMNLEYKATQHVVTGTIQEIQPNNKLLLSITKERGGYSIDDSVYVIYSEYIINKSNNTEETEIVNEMPRVGDEVSFQFQGNKIDHSKKIDCIETDKIIRYNFCEESKK